MCAAGRIIRRGSQNSCALCVITIARTQIFSHRHFERSCFSPSFRTERSEVRNPLAGCPFQGDLSLSLEMTGAGTMPPSSLEMTGVGQYRSPSRQHSMQERPAAQAAGRSPYFAFLQPFRLSEKAEFHTRPNRGQNPIHPSDRAAGRALSCPTERRTERRHSTTSSVPSIHLIS